MNPISRRGLLGTASACAATMAFPSIALSQSNTIRLIVTYPPGGIGDIVSRLIAQRMARSLNQSVIVENKPGASGRVGTQFVRTAAPDGDTLLLGNTATMVTGPAVWKSPGFDAVHDFVPVSHVIEFELAYAVAPNTPVKDLREYAKWVTLDPKNAVFGSPSIGGLGHFLGLQVGRALNVDLVHIGFKGSAPLTNDLMASQIPAGIDTLDAQMRARSARILATTGRKRSAYLPAVPTFTELGYPDVQGSGWFGYFAPAKTPKAVVDKLSRVIAAAARDPEIVQTLKAISYVPSGTTSEEFSRILQQDREKWQPLIKASGLVVDE